MKDRLFHIDLGDDHKLQFVRSGYDPGQNCGANIWHKKPDGSECCGFISFEGMTWYLGMQKPPPIWKVDKKEPLTLTPSVLCKTCGDHGFIREGKWVRA